MKTKINNGFKLKGVDSLDGVKAFVERVFNRFNTIADDIWARNVINDAVLNYDINDFYNIEFDGNYLADANELLEKDLLIACQKKIQTELDLEIRLYFQLIKNKKGNHVLGLHFIPNTELRALFLSINEIKNYSYVEETDESKSKSNSLKGQDWNKIFKLSSNPDIAMFCINISKTGPRKIEISKINKFIPDAKLRSQNVAHKMSIETMMASENIDERFKTNEDVSKYFNSDEHINHVNSESSKYITNLKHIDSDDLL